MRDEAHGYAAQGCTSPVADLYVGGKSFDVAKEGLAMVAAMKQKPTLRVPKHAEVARMTSASGSELALPTLNRHPSP